MPREKAPRCAYCNKPIPARRRRQYKDPKFCRQKCVDDHAEARALGEAMGKRMRGEEQDVIVYVNDPSEVKP
jgi:hypothetical protein